MVASAVLSLIVVLLVQVAGMVSNTWSQGQGRTERSQNGRALVDFIGRELRSAALPVDSRSTGNTPDLQFVVNPAGVPAQYRQPQAVFWQAPLATSTVHGNMAEIGYFVRWDDSSPTPRASLCRIFLNPGAGDHLVYSQLSWVTEAVLNSSAPADAANSYRGLFAENVVGLWVRCLDASGNAITQPGVGAGGYDSRVGYADQVHESTGTVANVTRSAPVLPTAVEVSVVVLDSRSASLLTAPMAATIKAAVARSATAAHCVETLQTNVSLSRIVVGMSSQTLKVHLESAP